MENRQIALVEGAEQTEVMLEESLVLAKRSPRAVEAPLTPVAPTLLVECQVQHCKGREVAG